MFVKVLSKYISVGRNCLINSNWFEDEDNVFVYIKVFVKMIVGDEVF